MTNTDIIFNAHKRHLYGTGDIPVLKVRAAYYEELRRKIDELYPVVNYQWWMDERCSVCDEPFSPKEWEGRHINNGCDCHEGCYVVCNDAEVLR